MNSAIIARKLMNQPTFVNTKQNSCLKPKLNKKSNKRETPSIAVAASSKFFY